VTAIAYKYKIGNRSKYNDIAYDMVCEIVESDQISSLLGELAANLADIYTKGLL
jgi:hypothetical protein